MEEAPRQGLGSSLLQPVLRLVFQLFGQSLEVVESTPAATVVRYRVQWR